LSKLVLFYILCLSIVFSFLKVKEKEMNLELINQEDVKPDTKNIRKLLEEIKAMTSLMSESVTAGSNKPDKKKEIKVPTTQADFEALEKARIKRHIKQVKRLK
jgi:hypothetical protein